MFILIHSASFVEEKIEFELRPDFHASNEVEDVDDIVCINRKKFGNLMPRGRHGRRVKWLMTCLHNLVTIVIYCSCCQI